MEFAVVVGAGVGDDEHMVVQMKGVTNGAIDAAGRGHAAHHERVEPPRGENRGQIGVEEGAVAGLGDGASRGCR